MTVRDLMQDERASGADRLQSQRRARKGLLLFLPIALVVVAVFGVMKWQAIRNDPIQILVRAAPHKTRPVQARLSGGFHWAPVRFPRGAESHVDDDGDTRRHFGSPAVYTWFEHHRFSREAKL